jgi:hypothetical protein
MIAPPRADPKRAGSPRADWIAGAAILLFSAVAIWEDRVLPLGTLAKPGPGMLPLALALALAGMGLLIFLSGDARILSLERREAVRAASIAGACAFAALMLERLGYRLTMAAVLFFLLAVVERRRPPIALAVAAALAAVSHYVFAVLLRVPLPRGPFGI